MLKKTIVTALAFLLMNSAEHLVYANTLTASDVPPLELETSKKSSSDSQHDHADQPKQNLLVTPTPLLHAPSSSIFDESFEQSAYGPLISAHAVAAEISSWKTWSDKWSQRKNNRIIGIPEVRTATVGTQIGVTVFLATKDAPFIAKENLNYTVSIYNPNGDLQETLSPSLCMLKGTTLEAGSMTLCESTIHFDLEEDDPKGQWVFKIEMNAPGQKPLVFGTSFESY